MGPLSGYSGEPEPLRYKFTSDMALLEALRQLRLTLPGKSPEETADAIWEILEDDS